MHVISRQTHNTFPISILSVAANKGSYSNDLNTRSHSSPIAKLLNTCILLIMNNLGGG